MFNKIPVLYNPDMVVADNNSTSPSAGKPKLAVAAWRQARLPIQIVESKPVTDDDLALVHDRKYVDGVLSGAIQNGFGGTNPAVAKSCLYTCGSMLDAAREALANKRVACSPTSGFHHACAAWGGGFCTFNGLMVTAYKLLLEDGVHHVSIIDCDYHYGNGTADIIEDAPTRLRNKITHYTTGIRHTQEGQAEDFLERILPRWLHSIKGTSILLYQAGADAHINDPLGGWMTDSQLRRRDRIVFEWAVQEQVPVAWNLAGGYQRDENDSIAPVLRIHTATMKECVAAFVEV
jgi:acetoin utilization deacetylase AcuC-like enzyme